MLHHAAEAGVQPLIIPTRRTRSTVIRQPRSPPPAFVCSHSRRSRSPARSDNELEGPGFWRDSTVSKRVKARVGQVSPEPAGVLLERSE